MYSYHLVGIVLIKNVFVSLGRLFNYPSRYISLNAKNGLIGHKIGQILVDGIWITVDNSAVDIINENYITSSNVDI